MRLSTSRLQRMEQWWIKRRVRCFRLAGVAIALVAGGMSADAQVLTDKNGDGVVTFLGFGDSITFGIGDEGNPLRPPEEEISDNPTTDTAALGAAALRAAPVVGGGYVSRLGTILGVQTINAGVPGEIFSSEGVARFPSVVARSNADVVAILGGANDAVQRVATGVFERALQRVLNVARLEQKTAVVLTPLPPCCEHDSLRPYTDAYDGAVRDVADINQVPVADIDRGWLTQCTPGQPCDLYNLPEGLHPNKVGYDLLAQVVAAALLEVDLFAPSGAQALAEASGLPVESILVQSDGGIATP